MVVNLTKTLEAAGRDAKFDLLSARGKRRRPLSVSTVNTGFAAEVGPTLQTIVRVELHVD